MSGLLDALGGLLDGADLGSLVGGQAGELTGIVNAVGGLVDGPTELASLEGVIDGLPLPSGLENIATLGTSLGSLEVPSDLSDALGPILTPITGLAGGLAGSGGGAAQVTAALDLIREIIRLVSGRVMGGASGMADAEGIQIPELPDLQSLRDALTQARTALQGLGPNLDAPRILQFLQQASSGYRSPLVRFPRIPLLDETMEALGTVATWQGLTAEQLNAHLARSVNLTAELIRTPRVRVAQPVLAAATAIANGRVELGRVGTELAPLFAALRERIANGNARPSLSELTRIEAAAESLKRVAEAVDHERSPLAGTECIADDLTRTLLGVLRALQPAYDVSAVTRRIDELIEAVPTAPADVFDEAIGAIDGFDLSAITGPLQTVTEAVQGAVDEVNGARDTVRTQLESALNPVADALDTALSAAGFNEIQAALDGLPATIDDFVGTEIEPNLTAVRDAIGGAVDIVSNAATTFNPETLIAPIRTAVEDAAALLQSEEVQGVFNEVEHALDTAIQALEGIDLTAAADESIGLLEDIEDTVSDIDPALIPDAAKPMIEQAVQVVTDVDFTGEVAEPLVDALQTALEVGPNALLGAMEEGMDEVRTRLESFKPSGVIGDELDAPFEQLTATLSEFRPSDLLRRLQGVMDELASRINVLDVGAVVDPLVEVHRTVREQVEALRPSTLLQPVEDAIDSAIEDVYAATGIDTVFDGVNDVLELVQSWTGLLSDGRDLLSEAASLLANPGDAADAVTAIVDGAVAKLDEVDLATLETAFEEAGAAVAGIERNALAADLARAFETAGSQGPALLASSEVTILRTLVRAFPLQALRRYPAIPVRRRLVEAMERMLAALSRMEAATTPWQALGTRLASQAGTIQEALIDYHNLIQVEGGTVFSQLGTPPATVDAVKDSVRSALVEGLSPPLTTVVTGFRAVAPYLEMLASGISDLLGAIHSKIDSIVGDEGLGGTVGAVEEAANLLRDIDLDPVTAPLDVVYGRIETAVNALDPEPLRAALEAVQAAITGLLDLTNLVDQADIDTLDQTYNTAVETIGALSPSALISQTLDPVYEDLLADILPILDLPARLRGLVETAGEELGEDAIRELARVEVAFDEMLRAIPLATGGQGVQASASVSVG